VSNVLQLETLVAIGLYVNQQHNLIFTSPGSK